ncbi:cyclin-domain-containing protein [Rhexocercosporidium sp. MPI-PUGE-AT-0058]|nr:cyclin-domain-containing protein [Rhexocercosporidium sp. MPI-PUGE-AT-0058]
MNSKVDQPVEPSAPLKVEQTEEPEAPTSAIAPSLPTSPTKPALQPESPGLKRRQSQGTAQSIPTTTQAIRTKRPRSDQEPKVLPAQYEFCAVEDIVILIANMIQELITTNDRLPLRSGVLTRFHSRQRWTNLHRTPPGISVLDYLQRLAKHATLTPPLLLSMVYYIDRLCLLYPAFTVTTLTVHRFLITAATVAAKGLSDSFWNNATYARVGGIKIAELGLLELDFLYRVDWKIVPNPEALVDYYNGLVERSDGYVIESDSSSIDEDDDDDDDSNDLEISGSGSEDKTEASPESTTDTKWKAWMDDVSTNKDGCNLTTFNPSTASMRFFAVALAMCAPVLAISSDLIDSTTVYIQSLTSKSAPRSLASIKFNPSTLSSEILSYEPPFFEEENQSSKLLRVGVYDPATATWKSSTTTTSVETFAKGYAPTIVLSLDAQGGVIGVSCKSSVIDAGQTRDFGPKVKVVKMREGAKPVLNTPVVLNPEGKVEEAPTEKTLLQKYWWVIAGGIVVMLTTGGGE